ncbi:WAT1-related protein At1g68170-like [Prosopis cineraria]|uniref:WAT1-related protein At1g68170-like n=1 Tax=Prosopis cineraria TaxID=364024 RepID=UPI00240FD0F5|nr:WAT1-related protein At1g68170-like [Prosopis cineraria]
MTTTTTTSDVCNVAVGLKPMLLMVMIALAAVNVLYKLAVNDGMNLRVLVAYRFLFTAVFMAPLALVLEWSEQETNDDLEDTVSSLSLWFIWTKMSESYPCHYSSTALMSVVVGIISIVFALSLERDMTQWKLCWNVRLLTVAYSGIVVSGVIVVVMAWCMRMRGLAYVSAFNPLMLVFVALTGYFMLDEKLHLGRAGRRGHFCANKEVEAEEDSHAHRATAQNKVKENNSGVREKEKS